MNRAIDLIQHLINEHYENKYCTDWQEVLDCDDISDCEKGLNLAYDVGRYETLKQLLADLMKMY